MEIKLIFNDLLKQINVLFKKYGFKKQGNTFYKRLNGNWALVSFQRSIKSTSSEIFFTINLGVYSHTIADFFDAEMAEKKPTIADCHWQVRVGDFVGNGQDIWWKVNESTNLTILTQEIESLLIKYALPSIEQLISDEQLENLWCSKLPDQLDFRPKLNLAILLKKSGKIDELKLILKQLEKETEGKATESFFKAVRTDLLEIN